MAALYDTLHEDVTDLLNRYDKETLFRQLRLLLQEYQEVQDLLDEKFPAARQESDTPRAEGMPAAMRSVSAAATGVL